jgi:hypothetical protein
MIYPSSFAVNSADSEAHHRHQHQQQTQNNRQPAVTNNGYLAYTGMLAELNAGAYHSASHTAAVNPVASAAVSASTGVAPNHLLEKNSVS